MEENVIQPVKWNIAQKIIFRFFAAYIIIYIAPFPFNFFAEGMWYKFEAHFNPIVMWSADHILHLSKHISVMPNGSGDTTYNYVQEFCFVILAISATLVWSILDRRRNNYVKLLYWVKVLVRYYLAYYLMVYGFSKLNHGQFSAPDVTKLMQPYGQSSPMGLAWTFLGFSVGYGIFMGLSESIGGILMLFRRTTLFGACIATTVIANIVMINFCYDVPVKLFSSHLLLFSLFVLITDGGNRFLDFFIRNGPIAPVDLSPIFKMRKWRITRIVVKAIFVVAIISLPIIKVIDTASYIAKMGRSPLDGLYSTQIFVYNSDTLRPLMTDSTRWNKIVFTAPGYAKLYKMNDSVSWQICDIDTNDKTLTLAPFKNGGQVYSVGYVREDSNTIILRGTASNSTGFIRKYDSVYIKMKRMDEHDFLLINRGFHWVSEHPFNR